MSKFGIGAAILVLALSAIAFFRILSNQVPKTQITPQVSREPIPQTDRNVNVNWQATFLIFTNGVKRNFENPKYHNLSQDIYLTDQNPTIIQIKKIGISWGDFFNTLPMKVTPDCLTTGDGEIFCSSPGAKLKFYLNDQTVNDLLSREIQDGDKLLISFGNEPEEQIKNQLQQVPNP